VVRADNQKKGKGRLGIVEERLTGLESSGNAKNGPWLQPKTGEKKEKKKQLFSITGVKKRSQKRHRSEVP